MVSGGIGRHPRLVGLIPPVKEHFSELIHPASTGLSQPKRMSIPLGPARSSTWGKWTKQQWL